WKAVRAWLLKTKAPEDSSDVIGQMNRYLEISKWAIGLVESLYSRSQRMTNVRSLRASAVMHLYVEDYGYSKNNKSAAHMMESGGIVRADIWRRFGLTMTNVSVTHARKLVFGFNPRKPAYDPKVFIQDTVFNKFKAPKTWGENECDALLVAQAGLSELGGLILTLQRTAKKERKGVKEKVSESVKRKLPRKSRRP